MRKTRLTRKTPLKRSKLLRANRASSGIKRKAGSRIKARKPIPKENAERRKKRRKKGKALHKLYLQSETARLVELRSGGRCEAIFDHGQVIKHWTLTYPGVARCTEPAVVHHHMSYHNYGGGEVPDQMLHICHGCHMKIHGLQGYKRR